MADVHIDISASGPVFDGQAEEIIDRYCTHVEQVIGDKGVAMIRAYLPTQYKYLKDPSSLGWHGNRNHFIPGLYQSVIHTVQLDDAVLIHDTPCVYGPWLEGVGSRNPVTRFKGYHTFRIISQVLNGMATDIATAELPRYIAEMNA